MVFSVSAARLTATNPQHLEVLAERYATAYDDPRHERGAGHGPLTEARMP
jgi:hypothetical protein